MIWDSWQEDYSSYVNALLYALEQYYELISSLYICPTHLIFAAQLISTYLAAAHLYRRYTEAYATGSYPMIQESSARLVEVAGDR